MKYLPIILATLLVLGILLVMWIWAPSATKFERGDFFEWKITFFGQFSNSPKPWEKTDQKYIKAVLESIDFIESDKYREGEGLIIDSIIFDFPRDRALTAAETEFRKKLIGKMLLFSDNWRYLLHAYSTLACQLLIGVIDNIDLRNTLKEVEKRITQKANTFEMWHKILMLAIDCEQAEMVVLSKIMLVKFASNDTECMTAYSRICFDNDIKIEEAKKISFDRIVSRPVTIEGWFNVFKDAPRNSELEKLAKQKIMELSKK